MSEQGHAKNLENLVIGRNFAAGWGAKYAPTNPVLALDKIDKLITDANTAMDDLQTARTPYRNATAAAEDAFAPLSKLITRVMRSLKVSGAADSFIADAETYARKIKGKSATPAVKDDPATQNVNEAAASHSTSQMSRTQRVENLDALILQLESNSIFNPNEIELKTTSLKDLSTDLKARITAVQTTFVPYSNKLNARDGFFYGKGTGIVDVGRLFKGYVESFGRDSQEWNQIKNLEFKEYKRRT